MIAHRPNAPRYHAGRVATLVNGRAKGLAIGVCRPPSAVSDATGVAVITSLVWPRPRSIIGKPLQQRDRGGELRLFGGGQLRFQGSRVASRSLPSDEPAGIGETRPSR